MMLVRCDASEQWGMGNLMRCRALAQALHDEGVAMAMVGPGMDMQQAGDSKLFHHWFPMPWQEHAVDNAKQLLGLSRELKAKVLVVDDPRANEAFQQVVYASQIPWLQFDGTATQPIWANWVLNALPHAKASAYAEVVRNPSAQLLLGPQFAVLRKEFANAAQQQVHKNDGGGYDSGESYPVTVIDQHHLALRHHRFVDQQV
jgi:UDP-2,4-diacetamido-2,4,6-trideoxy-beta-L-altropyranose hydrolase